MDPMELAEEDKRRKEEQDFKDLENAIGGLSEFTSDRDFLSKGKEVVPSGKQQKIVRTIAAQLKVSAPVNKRRSIGDVPSAEDVAALDSATLQEFDLLSKPRILINSGPITKKETDSLLRKASRKFIFLFSDVLLITSKKETVETYELQQIMWVKDMRIKHLDMFSEDGLSFEIISVKTRSRPQISFTFICESDTNMKNWIEDFENVLLAYHQDSKQLGWFHDIILGTMHSAAVTGDQQLLRRHLRGIDSSVVDITDNAGMTALHWAVLRGHEVCVRVLLDSGADPDLPQRGGNTALLLAAIAGHDNLCRLLLERGAQLRVRNGQDRDALFLAVVFGAGSKGLGWLLNLLSSRGMDLNQADMSGYGPLHVCAMRNLPRPVRMLVDAGADVNLKHGQNFLTPLQLACTHSSPDVETIRSFLDKGAFPNWKDLQNRTALDILFQNALENSNIHGNSIMEGSSESVDKWRPMEGTLKKVGDFAVKFLPVILELVKKGARFDPRILDNMRPSFRQAIQEGRRCWETQTGATRGASNSSIRDFVLRRNQSGEDLKLTRDEWTRNKASGHCLLCADTFGLTNRRHHCRSCGALVCDSCSSKRLQLTLSENESSEKMDRVCDACFNRLCFEASQPSQDHFRIRNMKQSAFDLIDSITAFLESLEDPEGETGNTQISQLRESLASVGIVNNSPNRRQSIRVDPSRRVDLSKAEASIEALKKRQEKLSICEDVAGNFLEAAESYHRVAKRLIEKKMDSERLWS